MKFIAIRDFRNHSPEDLKVIDAPKGNHTNHIPKGCFLEIGLETQKEKTALSKTDQLLVSQLGAACCIVDATNEKVVKQVQAEAAEANKAATRSVATAVAAK